LPNTSRVGERPVIVVAHRSMLAVLLTLSACSWQGGEPVATTVGTATALDLTPVLPSEPSTNTTSLAPSFSPTTTFSSHMPTGNPTPVPPDHLEPCKVKHPEMLFPNANFNMETSSLSPSGNLMAKVYVEQCALILYQYDPTPNSWREIWGKRINDQFIREQLPRPGAGAGPPATLGVLTFSPDSSRIAISLTNAIEIFDADTGSLLQTIYTPQDNISVLKFSGDGNSLASGDHSVLVWNVLDGSMIHAWAGYRYGKVSDLALSSHGEVIAGEFDSSGQILGRKFDHTRFAWDASTKKILWDQYVPNADDITISAEFALSPDGSLLFIATTKPEIQIWNLRGGVLQQTIPLPTPKYGNTSPILGLSPDGSILAVSGDLGSQGTIIYEGPGWKKKFSIPRGFSSTFEYSIHFSQDGHLIIISSPLEMGVVLDISSGSILPEKPKVGSFHFENAMPAQLPISRAVSLSRLFMMDASTGWGISRENNILFTTDGGRAWHEVNPPEEILNHHLFALDANHAWDGLAWRTIDGGKTWQKTQSMPEITDLCAEHNIKDIQFIDPDTGWVLVDDYCGGNADYIYVFPTKNGGSDWNAPILSLPVSSTYSGLIFTTPSQGYIGYQNYFSDKDFPYYGGIPTVGDYLTGTKVHNLQETMDGGATWHGMDLPRLPFAIASTPHDKEIRMDCGIYSLNQFPRNDIRAGVHCKTYPPKFGSDPLFGILTQEAANIQKDFKYLSVNGGKTWQVWADDSVDDGYFGSTGWRLYSAAPDAPNVLQRTTDGGYHWTTIHSVAWQKVQFNFFSDTAGFALATIGDLTSLLRTDDGGMTWQEIKMAWLN
jgi:WD40 repeat protein